MCSVILVQRSFTFYQDLKKKIKIKKDQITQTNPKKKKKNKKQHFIFYFLNTPKPEILINISF